MSFPVASRWRSNYDIKLAYGCVQTRNPNTYEKFLAFWTIYLEDIRFYFFMAKASKWPPRHGHTVVRKRKLLITFDPKHVKSAHSKFHEDHIKSLGGVR